ncbi:osteopontin [Trichomycterus rosablanca]|uniref:osteopontin n=1 Tax=Trichomycterus rosablanca TaxID=2290929 RepID=UPI002F34FF3B
MKAVIVFMLLFAVVFCKPVKRSSSSSESSEEKPVAQKFQAMQVASKSIVVPTEEIIVNEDVDDDDDDSDDDDDKMDDDDKDDSSDESEETTTIPPMIDTTQLPITENTRGDNMGYYGDYKKTIYYEKDNYIEKEPSAYKFEYGSDKEVDVTNKKMSDLKLYKTVLDHGMGAFSGTDGDEMSDSQLTMGSQQAEPEQVDLKTSTSANDTNDSASSQENSPESSEESSEETSTMPANSSSSDSASQSAEFPKAVLAK